MWDAVAYTYCNCYADSDGNRHRYPHSNSYTDTNTYFHAHTEVSAHTEGSSHSATPALIPEREVIRLRQGYGGQVSDWL